MSEPDIIDLCDSPDTFRICGARLRSATRRGDMFYYCIEWGEGPVTSYINIRTTKKMQRPKGRTMTLYLTGDPAREARSITDKASRIKKVVVA